MGMVCHSLRAWVTMSALVDGLGVEWLTNLI